MRQKVVNRNKSLKYLIALVIIPTALLALALNRGNLSLKSKIVSPEIHANLQPTPIPNATQVVGSFTNSSGQNRYLIQVTLADDSSILKNYLYLSPERDYTKGKRILTTFQSQSIIRSSENKGTKYIVDELDGGDETSFALFDENGTLKDLDFAAITNRKDLKVTKSKFGQWQNDVQTNFSLIFTMSDGSQSEAVFSAETGQLVKNDI